MDRIGKSAFRRIVLVVLAGAILTALPSCQKKQAAETPAAKQFKIGFSAYGLDQPFHKTIYDTVKAEVEKAGAVFIGTDSRDDINVQINAIEDLIAQKIDLLIMAPVNSDQIQPALEACKAANIPVVNYDTPATDQSLVNVTVTSDNVAAGRIAGEYLLKNVGITAGKVLIFDNPGTQSVDDRVKGFLEATKGTGIVPEYIHFKGTMESIHSSNEDGLSSNPDAVAYFGTVSILSTDACAVLAAQGRAGKLPLISVDGSPDEKPYIKTGEMLATAAQSPIGIAKQSVESALKLLKGESVQKTVQIPPFIIDKANLDQYPIDGWQ
jgi:ribose transport system substrate-binding protein